MKRKQKEEDFTLTAKVLMSLFIIFEFLPRPFEGKTHYFKRQISGYVPYKSYLNIMQRLEDRGLIKIFKDKQGKQYLQLTKDGILETLFLKARLDKPLKWDGKWRMIIFDIPEDAKGKRKQLRSLLYRNNFTQMQKSVYISPYALNKEAIKYLQETGLDEFIRILRIDAIDKDQDLKKKYGLK